MRSRSLRDNERCEVEASPDGLVGRAQSGKDEVFQLPGVSMFDGRPFREGESAGGDCRREGTRVAREQPPRRRV